MADPQLTTEEKREFFVSNVLETWRAKKDATFFSKVYGTITRAMEFVGGYANWTGADKKAEVLEIIALVLKKTDSPGPDILVDWIIQEGAEAAIDYLWDAANGKFSFGAQTPS